MVTYRTVLKIKITMSTQYVKLCSVILKQVFGDIVQKVGDSLFSSPSRTLSTIVKTTKLNRLEVVGALSILIKFGVVHFEKSATNENIVEYSIKKEEILNILKYPKYVYHIQTKYGNVGASITEELLRLGFETATCLLSKCFLIAENKDNLANYRDMFLNLITEHYIIRQPMPVKLGDEINTIPTLKIEDHEYFKLPEIDLKSLQENLTLQKPVKDLNEPYWRINFPRFNRDFRDILMTSVVEKKLGSGAAECFRLILKIMYTRTHSWEKHSSNPITLVEIKQIIDKKTHSADVVKYLENYVTLIAEDSIGFIRKIGEMGGGQYFVDFKKAFEELALTCVENVINEKFGSKAARLFRVIKTKKFIEQEDIQKEAMIPAKEAKLLTYNLLQEQLIQIKTIRKAGGGGAGPAKSFFLFHINLNAVVFMLLDICHKSMCNIITRSVHDKCENKRLIDKSQKLKSIVETMKERGESEEYIAEILETLTPPEREILKNVKIQIKSLSNAELVLEDTIFLLKLYQFHTGKTK